MNIQKRHEPFVNAEKAGEYIGYSAVTLRRLAKAGTIPALGIPSGGKTLWRFRLSELDEYVQALNKKRLADEGSLDEPRAAITRS